MSVNSEMTLLANAVREKTGYTGKMTISDMAEKVGEIFSAFYSFTYGSGGEYLTFENVPFECRLVSIMLRWGIGNINGNDVYSVFYNGSSADSRYRKRNGTSTTPYNVSGTVKVTSTKNENSTYTVKIYCDGCLFNKNQTYVVFLAHI